MTDVAESATIAGVFHVHPSVHRDARGLFVETYNWSPTIEFPDGLPETIEWYAANRAWWEPLVGRAPVREDIALT